MTMNDQIKAAREARGWSQEDLAAEARVHRMTVHYIENGNVSPTAATLQKIATALQIDLTIKSA